MNGKILNLSFIKIELTFPPSSVQGQGIPETHRWAVRGERDEGVLDRVSRICKKTYPFTLKSAVHTTLFLKEMKQTRLCSMLLIRLCYKHIAFHNYGPLAQIFNVHKKARDEIRLQFCWKLWTKTMYPTKWTNNPNL